VKIVREIYDFVTGGSIAAPIGLTTAIIVALLVQPTSLRVPVFVATIGLTFVASVFEKPN
jgi:hypothetical protein